MYEPATGLDDGGKKKKFFLNDCCNYSGILLDFALVDSALDVNVTRLAPSGSPRVADDPVGNSVSGSPADDDHTVIDWQIVARDVIVDTAPVREEF
jgi:hypothetical protein